MKKVILLSIVLTLTTGFSVFAKKRDSVKQYKDYGNTIILSSTYLNFPKIYRQWSWQLFIPLPYFGLSAGDAFSINYERKVYKNWRLGASYTTWNEVPWLINGIYSAGGLRVGTGPNSGKVGYPESRRKYKMYDLYADYKINYFRKHKITAGIGLSYTWGLNLIVDSFYWDPRSFESYDVEHEEKAYYYGVLGIIRYDYLLFRNRVNVGADFKYRKYSGLYSHELDYGFHLAVNF